jgi:hypothetical protein
MSPTNSAPHTRSNALLRWLATLALLVPLQGCTTEYSAMPIEAWVVDAETNQPVPGVIVIASWVLEGGLEGGNQLDRMMVMEAVTDSAGKFSFPAWGPKKVPSYPRVYSNARLKEMDPQLFLFKDDHRYLWLLNEKTSKQMASQGPSMRTSDWNGKTIKLKPFKGNIHEYKENVSAFSTALDSVTTKQVCTESSCYGTGACDWNHTPKAIAELGKQERIPSIRGTTVYTHLLVGAEYFSLKGCGSTVSAASRPS